MGKPTSLFSAEQDGADLPYWKKVGIVDSEENYFTMFGVANKKDCCINCCKAGHSVVWCQLQRKPELLCQICMCGSHSERLCDGSEMAVPGNYPPPLMWKSNVRMWVGRVASMGGAAPERGRDKGDDKGGG